MRTPTHPHQRHQSERRREKIREEKTEEWEREERKRERERERKREGREGDANKPSLLCRLTVELVVETLDPASCGVRKKEI